VRSQNQLDIGDPAVDSTITRPKSALLPDSGLSMMVGATLKNTRVRKGLNSPRLYCRMSGKFVELLSDTELYHL
jgi:hypothetical protein